MNWTDRPLYRFNRSRGYDAGVARQKEHFARVRSMLQVIKSSVQSSDAHSSSSLPSDPLISPSACQVLPDIGTTAPRRGTKRSFDADRSLTVSSAADRSCEKDRTRNELEYKRRKLLERDNWAGVDLLEKVELRLASPLKGFHNFSSQQPHHGGGRKKVTSASPPNQRGKKPIAEPTRLLESPRLGGRMRIRIGSVEVRNDLSSGTDEFSAAGYRAPGADSRHGRRKPRGTAYDSHCTEKAAARANLAHFQSQYRRRASQNDRTSSRSSLDQAPTETMHSVTSSSQRHSSHSRSQTSSPSRLLQPKPLRFQRPRVLDSAFAIHEPDDDAESTAVQVGKVHGEPLGAESEDWWKWAAGHFDQDADTDPLRKQKNLQSDERVLISPGISEQRETTHHYNRYRSPLTVQMNSNPSFFLRKLARSPSSISTSDKRPTRSPEPLHQTNDWAVAEISRIPEYSGTGSAESPIELFSSTPDSAALTEPSECPLRNARFDPTASSAAAISDFVVANGVSSVSAALTPISKDKSLRTGILGESRNCSMRNEPTRDHALVPELGHGSPQEEDPAVQHKHVPPVANRRKPTYFHTPRMDDGDVGAAWTLFVLGSETGNCKQDSSLRAKMD